LPIVDCRLKNRISEIAAACRAQSRPEFAARLSIAVEGADENQQYLDPPFQSAIGN